MCVKELIANIIEHESISGNKADPELVREVLLNCPLEVDLPRLEEDSARNHQMKSDEQSVQLQQGELEQEDLAAFMSKRNPSAPIKVI